MKQRDPVRRTKELARRKKSMLLIKHRTPDGMLASMQHHESRWIEAKVGVNQIKGERQRQRLEAAARSVLEHYEVYAAAVYRLRKMADRLELSKLADALQENAEPTGVYVALKETLALAERRADVSLNALMKTEAKRPQVTGITAMEAAVRYGYSRSGARERLERGVRQRLLQKSQDMRNGKVVVVYSPTEEAGRLFTTLALPEGRIT